MPRISNIEHDIYCYGFDRMLISVTMHYKILELSFFLVLSLHGKGKQIIRWKQWKC